MQLRSSIFIYPISPGLVRGFKKNLVMQIKYKDNSFEVEPINENEHIQKHWAKGVFYEASMLQYIEENYPKNMNIIDVGGCVGNHALFFAGVMNARNVLVFEPVKELFECINMQIILNDFDIICDVENVALGNRKKKTKMQLSDLNVNAGMSKIDNEGDYEIQVVKLDSYKFDKLDLIKIDIEGANKAMLQGAKQTILKHKPDIFIEADGDFDEVNEILENYGYKYSGKQFNRTPTFLFTSC